MENKSHQKEHLQHLEQKSRTARRRHDVFVYFQRRSAHQFVQSQHLHRFETLANLDETHSTATAPRIAITATAAAAADEFEDGIKRDRGKDIDGEPHAPSVGPRTTALTHIDVPAWQHNAGSKVHCDVHSKNKIVRHLKIPPHAYWCELKPHLQWHRDTDVQKKEGKKHCPTYLEPPFRRKHWQPADGCCEATVLLEQIVSSSCVRARVCQRRRLLPLLLLLSVIAGRCLVVIVIDLIHAFHLGSFPSRSTAEHTLQALPGMPPASQLGLANVAAGRAAKTIGSSSFSFVECENEKPPPPP
jgi:hypothetical protein